MIPVHRRALPARRPPPVLLMCPPSPLVGHLVVAARRPPRRRRSSPGDLGAWPPPEERAVPGSPRLVGGARLRQIQVNSEAVA
jgi:hypothetical protein